MSPAQGHRWSSSASTGTCGVPHHLRVWLPGGPGGGAALAWLPHLRPPPEGSGRLPARPSSGNVFPVTKCGYHTELPNSASSGDRASSISWKLAGEPVDTATPPKQATRRKGDLPAGGGVSLQSQESETAALLPLWANGLEVAWRLGGVPPQLCHLPGSYRSRPGCQGLFPSQGLQPHQAQLGL